MDSLDILLRVVEASLRLQFRTYDVKVAYKYDKDTGVGEIFVDHVSPILERRVVASIITGKSEDEKANRTFIYGLLVHELVTTNILALVR